MMTGCMLDAISAGTRTARRKRPEPMQMLLICDLLDGKRDVIILLLDMFVCLFDGIYCTCGVV